MNHIKFFIYARKSTDDKERQIRSIEDQVAEARELAMKHNLEVVDVLLEKQSAKRPGRPVFNEMLERIAKGEASGIIAWHPDRLARNMSDGGRVIDMLDFGTLEDLRFPTLDFKNNSQGKFTLAMLFGMSKYYVDSLSENIKRGQRQKVKNGVWPMVAPVGYINDKDAKCIVKDEERALLIRKAFEFYASGSYTLDRLTETMTALGLTNGAGTKHKGKPLSRAQYSRLLRNPIYYGTFRYWGEHHEGKHEPLISKALFDQCQEVLARKSQPKMQEMYKRYLYRGMFRCGECGCYITTETQKGHNYLRCTKRVKKDCSQPYVREEKIDEQITEVLASVAIPDEWSDWMIGQLEQQKKTDMAQEMVVEQSFQNQIKSVDEKTDRLMAGYLEQLFGAEEYKAKKSQLLAEKQELKEKITAIGKNRSSRFEPAMRFVLDLKQAKKLALSGKAEEKREFLKTVGSNLKLVNRTLRFVPRNAWQLVVDSGRFGQDNAAPLCNGAAFNGEPIQNHNEAERRRFELLMGFHPYRFSKPAHSTALPPLQEQVQDDSREDGGSQKHILTVPAEKRATRREAASGND